MQDIFISFSPNRPLLSNISTGFFSLSYVCYTYLSQVCVKSSFLPIPFKIPLYPSQKLPTADVSFSSPASRSHSSSPPPGALHSLRLCQPWPSSSPLHPSPLPRRFTLNSRCSDLCAKCLWRKAGSYTKSLLQVPHHTHTPLPA